MAAAAPPSFDGLCEPLGERLDRQGVLGAPHYTHGCRAAVLKFRCRTANECSTERQGVGGNTAKQRRRLACSSWKMSKCRILAGSRRRSRAAASGKQWTVRAISEFRRFLPIRSRTRGRSEPDPFCLDPGARDPAVFLPSPHGSEPRPGVAGFLQPQRSVVFLGRLRGLRNKNRPTFDGGRGTAPNSILEGIGEYRIDTFPWFVRAEGGDQWSEPHVRRGRLMVQLSEWLPRWTRQSIGRAGRGERIRRGKQQR